jgi:hypothetical protein
MSIFVAFFISFRTVPSTSTAVVISSTLKTINLDLESSNRFVEFSHHEDFGIIESSIHRFGSRCIDSDLYIELLCGHLVEM